MKTFKNEQTRHAIYDPDREMFVSKSNTDYGYLFGALGTLVKWTDNPKDIWSHVDPEHILGWAKDERVLKSAPRAHVVAIVQTIRVTGRPYQEADLEVTYARQIDTYSRLKPAFDLDADAMPKSDWTAFKNARRKLKEVGLLTNGVLKV